MSFSHPYRLVVSLALFLLSSAAFAEPKAALNSNPPQVQIKVDFVVTNAADVDNLGINFDLIPLTAPSTSMPGNQKPAFLEYAAGNMARQLYQTLVRTRGLVIASQTITTANGTAAVVRVNTSIPSDTKQAETANGFALFPKLTTVTQVQGELTLIPQVHPDSSVTLRILPSPDSASPKTAFGKLIVLRTVPSGEMLVLSQILVKQDIPILGGRSLSYNQMSKIPELLIFITPTILGQKVDQ